MTSKRYLYVFSFCTRGHDHAELVLSACRRFISPQSCFYDRFYLATMFPLLLLAMCFSHDTKMSDFMPFFAALMKKSCQIQGHVRFSANKLLWRDSTSRFTAAGSCVEKHHDMKSSELTHFDKCTIIYFTLR